MLLGGSCADMVGGLHSQRGQFFRIGFWTHFLYIKRDVCVFTRHIIREHRGTHPESGDHVHGDQTGALPRAAQASVATPRNGV